MFVLITSVHHEGLLCVKLNDLIQIVLMTRVLCLYIIHIQGEAVTDSITHSP